MIGNLSENAAKWGRTRLRITVRTPPDRLVLRIEDDGPGLSPDQAPWP
ncbi:ATP-binding protein [Paracoccus sp. NBH48]|nr:ATP-binding protein [Paracoccus sp. NBH48]